MTATITTTPLVCLLCARSPAAELRHDEDGETVSATVRVRPGSRPLLRGLRCPDCAGGLYRDEGEATSRTVREPPPPEEARPKRGRPPRSTLIASAEPRPEVPAPCRVCRLVPSRDASHRLCWPCEYARRLERAKEQSA